MIFLVDTGRYGHRRMDEFWEESFQIDFTFSDDLALISDHVAPAVPGEAATALSGLFSNLAAGSGILFACITSPRVEDTLQAAPPGEAPLLDDIGPFGRDSERPRPWQMLAEQFERTTRPISRRERPLSFDPDDYPIA